MKKQNWHTRESQGGDGKYQGFDGRGSSTDPRRSGVLILLPHVPSPKSQLITDMHQIYAHFSKFNCAGTFINKFIKVIIKP